MGKKKAKAKAKAKIKQKPVTSAFRSLLKKIIIYVLLIGFLGIGIYTLYLNQLIQSKFETNRWSLPAKVYARVLELYPGMQITVKDIENELFQTGYRKDKKASTQGSFSRSSNQFIIVLRDFYFSDGSYRKSLRAKVIVKGGQITAIYNQRTTKKLMLLRLEPPLIDTIYPLVNEDRILIAQKDIPDNVIKAIVAIEDQHFFQHLGIDPLGILRALWVNIQAGKMLQGGSTLTQQLVKNYFLSNERTLKRKFNEALMALLLEFNYSKNEILTAYMNAVFLGQDGRRAIHGFALAAQYFYKRQLKQLSLPQLAMLAGLVKGPSFYNPRKHPQRAKKRRNLVLKVMLEKGFISSGQYQKAQRSQLGISKKRALQQSKYPAFISLLRRHLKQYYDDKDLLRDGIKIFTTLDPRLQNRVQKQVAKSIKRLPKHQKLQGAMLITNRGAADILALVGSKAARGSHFNRVIDAKRSIGSLVKPAVFLTALENGYDKNSLIDDSPLSIKTIEEKPWEPKNFDKKSHGLVSLQEALSHSYNIATVRLGMQLGLKNIVNTLRRLGISQDLDIYPAILLGAIPLSPLQVHQMYQTIADGGYYSPLKSIRAVLDKNNQIVQHMAIDVEKRFNRASIEQLEQMLKMVVRVGTAKSLQRSIASIDSIAAKTGTTNNNRDSWFVAYDDNYVSTVWLGNDDNTATKVTGASGALKVWATVKQNLPNK